MFRRSRPTHDGEESDRLRASKAGFDLLLVKPVDPDKLEATIRGLSG